MHNLLQDGTQEVSKHVAGRASVVFTFSAYRGFSELKQCVTTQFLSHKTHSSLRHKQARGQTMNTVLRGTYTYINLYVLCCLCATVDSALVRTTQCALCSTALYVLQ
jgi:hypothetical protein